MQANAAQSLHLSLTPRRTAREVSVAFFYVEHLSRCGVAFSRHNSSRDVAFSRQNHSRGAVSSKTYVLERRMCADKVTYQQRDIVGHFAALVESVAEESGRRHQGDDGGAVTYRYANNNSTRNERKSHLSECSLMPTK